MAVPNLYKLTFFLFLCLLSCTEEKRSNVEVTGFSLNSEGIFVDTIYLDSVHYASGAKVWCLRGVLVMDGDAYPYSLLYAENPLKSNSMMLQSNPPTFFPVEGKELKSVMTKSNGVITISWKSGKKKLLVRSALTSEH